MSLRATHRDESRMTFAPALWLTLLRSAARFISTSGMVA
jgi:hypothetical protein